MMHSFTTHQLIRYIYGEMTSTETMLIEEALTLDADLYDEYLRLKEGYRQLPKVKFNPTKKSINNILAYSQQTTVGTTH